MIPFLCGVFVGLVIAAGVLRWLLYIQKDTEALEGIEP